MTPELPPLLDLRVKSWIPDVELKAKVGKILTPSDYNAVMTGPVRLWHPEGRLLAVYVPGALTAELAAAWPVLTRIRQVTDNRGDAAGSERVRRGDQARTRARRVTSTIVGAIDPGSAGARTAGRIPVCRLTAWTGRNLDRWAELRPLAETIDSWLSAAAPNHHARMRAVAARTHPDWIIGSSVFTTLTVNNTYSTGVHVDRGDLDVGFSTLAVSRRGNLVGGLLTLPRYRVAFDLHDGDLLMFDAHEHHGNTPMMCLDCGTGAHLERPCAEHGTERISVVAYYRTKVEACGSEAEETAKAAAALEARTAAP